MDNLGGKTPDPRSSGAGNRTPMYGAKSSYTGREDNDRGEGGSGSNNYNSNNNYSGTSSNRTKSSIPARFQNQPQSAPTPGNYNDNNDWVDNSAPTPAASVSFYFLLVFEKVYLFFFFQAPYDYSRSQAKTPYGAPTPYSEVETPGGAPTPGVFGAPTPAAYGGAPTPAVYNGAPTPYGAPTPGYGGAPTPAANGGYSQTPGGGIVATPAGGYGPTPGYHGAATSAAQPLDYVQRVHAASTLPADWVTGGLKVTFIKSAFENGQFDETMGQFSFPFEIFVLFLFC